MKLHAQQLDSVYKAAIDLYIKGNYIQSADWLKRIVYFDRHHQYDSLVYPILGDIYYKQNEYDKSAYYYLSALKNIRCKDSITRYELKIVRNNILANHFIEALTVLDSIETNKDSAIWFQKQLLYAISFFGIEEYDSSKVCFLRLIDLKDSEKITRINDLFKKIKVESKHKYRVAIILSVILPGSGQILLGHTKDGINAFLLTSAFAAFTIVTAVNYTPIEALLSAFPWWLRYYRGNINHVLEQAEWKRFHKRSVLYQKVLSIVSVSQPK